MAVGDINVTISKEGLWWEIEWDGYVQGQKVTGPTMIQNENIASALKIMGEHIRWYMGEERGRALGAE